MIMNMTAETAGYLQPDNPAAPCILVIEDDSCTCKLFTFYLRRFGYRVDSASNGEEALAKAARSPPAAIVLDIILPDIDGWDVMAVLKDSTATRDIPVIIVTVLDRQPLGFDRGATEFLIKPVKCAELTNAVACSLRRHGAAQQRRLMVVDDDAAELDMVSDELVRQGYKPVRALGKLEAFHLIRSLDFDLIVVALEPSVQDCLDLLFHLGGSTKSRMPPIRVLARGAVSTALRSLLQSAAPDCLVITTEEGRLDTLVEAVNRALGQVEAS